MKRNTVYVIVGSRGQPNEPFVFLVSVLTCCPGFFRKMNCGYGNRPNQPWPLCVLWPLNWYTKVIALQQTVTGENGGSCDGAVEDSGLLRAVIDISNGRIAIIFKVLLHPDGEGKTIFRNVGPHLYTVTFRTAWILISLFYLSFKFYRSCGSEQRTRKLTRPVRVTCW